MADGSLLIAALAAAGAVAAGAAAILRPAYAIGILFVLASFSRVTLETPVGTMRLEQPAIASVVAVLILSRRGSMRSVPRALVLVVAAFAAYLIVLTLSSAVVALDRGSSLRLVAWLAVSMLGGCATFVLVRRTNEWPLRELAFGGALKGSIGLLVAVIFLVGGPSFDFGIQEADAIMPRVHALTWESNLYASFLAICLPIGLEAARGRRNRLGLAMLALIAIGMPLGQTRGAYLGAAAGLIAYGAIRLAADRRPTGLLRPSGVCVTAFAIGLAITPILLPNAIQRQLADAPPQATAAPPSSAVPNGTGGSATVEPRPTASPTPLASVRPYPDTIGYRLDRVPIALGDLAVSPLIGLGAESFGQRHLDPSQVGAVPDHIAILAIATLHDAGVTGAIALGVAFLLLLIGLLRMGIRAGRHRAGEDVGAAAAFTGSIVAMLVSYQATNALHFAVNWILIGAAAAVLAGRRDPAGGIVAGTL